MSPQKRKSEFEDCLAVDQRRLRSMARDLRHLFGSKRDALQLDYDKLLEKSRAAVAQRRERLVVTGEMANDVLTLKVETACSGPDNLSLKLTEAIRDVTKLRGQVELLPPGSLPNDGKVIEDARSYK